MFTNGAGLVIEDWPDARSVHPRALSEYGVVGSNVTESRRMRFRLLSLMSSSFELVSDAVDC